MKQYLTIAFAASLMAINAPVHATGRDHGVNQRQHHQVLRIRQGIKSGELTRPEVKHLTREQQRIRRMERKFRSDGELTFKERARLQGRLNRASHHIYQEKHDNQQRQRPESPEPGE